VSHNRLRRADESPDEEFYRSPRFVTHIDGRAIETVKQLYREYFPVDGSILDLMSSWVSHLPEEATYSHVTGLGLNFQELENNPRLDRYVVQNLNENPVLPFSDNEFGAAGICVSIDYLARPVEVLHDLGRVLEPGAPVVITFSNRCFPDKVVSVWLELDDRGRMSLVEDYLREAGDWSDVHSLDRSPEKHFSDPLYAVIGHSYV